jgi:hypothetical protein
MYECILSVQKEIALKPAFNIRNLRTRKLISGRNYHSIPLGCYQICTDDGSDINSRLTLNCGPKHCLVQHLGPADDGSDINSRLTLNCGPQHCLQLVPAQTPRRLFYGETHSGLGIDPYLSFLTPPKVLFFLRILSLFMLIPSFTFVHTRLTLSIVIQWSQERPPSLHRYSCLSVLRYRSASRL